VNVRIPRRPRRLLATLVTGTALVVAGPVAVAQAAVHGADASGVTVHFPGLPQVGALFDAPDYTGADAAHFCTGTVIDSPRGDLVLTAAHCVWNQSTGTYTHDSITFAPGYDNGPNAFLGGVWNVTAIHVAPGYVANGDEEDDYALLQIAPQRGGLQIQDVTGGLRLAAAHLPEPVSVVGYNNLEWDPAGNEAIVCHTQAFEETDDSLPWARFNCPNYQDGTSGGPWIAPGGRVVGVIGGYEQGGDTPNWSYSALFGADTLSFYRSVAFSR
jgi:hypothetical protein